MLSRKLLQLLLVFLLPALTMAQTTTSSMSGSVKTDTGEPLVGATIKVTHEPTGSVYTVQSRSGGRFDISNMNPGGPYTVEISFLNFAIEKKTDIYLNLGENFKVDMALSPKANDLGNVVVTGAKKTIEISGKGGTETTIGRDKIENLPSVGRNLQDFLRFTPQAKLSGVNGNLTGISIAGQNNRYNSFYIDGAVNNDVFGLSASGTNGGQTGVSPISIDAIDQFQVVISPYDASIGNFTGGGINATTRSGTNKTTGSVYTYFNNQNFVGKTPTGPKDKATKLSNFTTKTYGFRVGGPIVKNKIFYFINVESIRNQRPQPFDITQYKGASKQADIDNLSSYIKTKYGYNTGGYLDNAEKTDADRIAAKIDWNLSTKNKLSLSYRYNKAVYTNPSATSSTTINFFNDGVYFPSTTNSLSAELKTFFNNGSNNRLLLTYTGVRDDRGPLGSPFPYVAINDGTSGRIVFGSEQFSTANLLTQNNYNLLDYFKFNLGKNYFTVGTDNEYSKSNNVFIRQNYGAYQYRSVADFLNDAAPSRYDRSFSLIDNVTGDNTAAAAKFNTLRLGAFVNDEIRVNDNFTLNVGVRADWTKFITKPLEDQFFNQYAVDAISQYYDLQGARAGQISSPKISISPRLGFTYKIPEENVTIRGGLGLFTGRIPLVWPGGVYNQNGVSLGGISLTSAGQLQNIKFRPDPNGQYTAQELGISLANAKGEMDLIAKDFKLPKLFRTSLAIDKKFGNGWTATMEGIFSSNINEIYYQNVSLIPPAYKATGPDNRNVYVLTGSPKQIPLGPNSSTPYTNGIYLLSNNSGPKGFAYNMSFILDKAFNNGFAFNVSYTYGNSVVTNEGTSSQNQSQWRFTQTVNGRNYVGRSTSDYDLGHRVVAYVSKKFTYAGKSMATTVSLIYTGQSGNPYSYMYRNSIVNDNGFFESNDLIYIPTQNELQSMVYVQNGALSPTAQKAALESYIQGDAYLSKHRGQYAERNGGRLPFTNDVDLKIAQDFNIKIGKSRYQFQVTYDMFNFTNFLNRDWGRQYFLSFNNFSLIQFNGFQTGTSIPTYKYNPVNGTPWGVSTSTAPSLSARWVSQLGIRFNF